MRLSMFIITLSLLAPLPAAHSQEKPDCESRLEQNKRRIELLEAEVQVLRSELDELKKHLPDRKARQERRRPRPAMDTDPLPTKDDYSNYFKNLTPGCHSQNICRYLLNRKKLNEVLNDLGKLGRQARVIPNYDRDTGTYKGFKLVGVRPNSFYRAIGIRSGDVLVKVNNVEMNTPSKALELFTQFQTKSVVILHITRKGISRLHIYQVVEDMDKPAPPLPEAVERRRPEPSSPPAPGVTPISEMTYDWITPKDPNCPEDKDCEFTIDRPGMEAALKDLSVYKKQARFIPNFDRDSNNYKGFKLIGVRPNSIYKALGFRSGDVILQFNGIELNSPSKALELFNLAYQTDVLIIDFQRQDSYHINTYKIR